MTVTEIINEAHDQGMAQIRKEIEDFAVWLCWWSGRAPLRHVMEIGTLKGGTTLMWGRLSNGLVISVDLPDGRWGAKDHGYDWKRCTERNEDLATRIGTERFFWHLGNSHDYTSMDAIAGALKGELLDMLFIDGDHSYAGVKQDFGDYSPFVRPGGLVVFHDIKDTDFHHKAGVYVDQFWRELPADKRIKEFTCPSDPWGGIGVYEV